MTETKTLTYTVQRLKAPDAKGQFTAIIAQTFAEDAPKSSADADGDIFLVGAFDSQNRETVPVFYQHNYAPTSEVGWATLYPRNSRTSLPAVGQLKVSKGWPIADAVYESMLLPADDPAALREFSVGYSYETKDVYRRPDGVRIIRKSRVDEVSIVYKGAQRTELLSVKYATKPRVSRYAASAAPADALAQLGALTADIGFVKHDEAMKSATVKSQQAMEAFEMGCLLMDDSTDEIPDLRMRPHSQRQEKADRERREHEGRMQALEVKSRIDPFAIVEPEPTPGIRIALVGHNWEGLP